MRSGRAYAAVVLAVFALECAAIFAVAYEHVGTAASLLAMWIWGVVRPSARRETAT